MENKKNDYLAIDIGGTAIKSALINQSGRILTQSEVATPKKSLVAFLQTLDEIIVPNLAKIQGIGFSIPGTIDSQSGTIYHGGSLPYLDTFKLVTSLEDQYQKQIVIENDGKAAALAELFDGGLKGINNGMAITLGTGLGGGLVINGNLYKGVNFQAGEISFVLENQAKGDYYGLKYSAVGMINEIASQLNLANKNDGRAVFNLINEKNDIAWPIFKNYCRGIATLIYNIQVVLDLEVVAIGGGISSQKIVVEQIKHELNEVLATKEIVNKIIKLPRIVLTKHRNSANLIGAVYPFLTH